MRSIRRALSNATEALLPNRDLLRVRFRVSLDMLITLAITALAVGMAVAYQVLRRLGPRRADMP